MGGSGPSKNAREQSSAREKRRGEPIARQFGPPALCPSSSPLVGSAFPSRLSVSVVSSPFPPLGHPSPSPLSDGSMAWTDHVLVNRYDRSAAYVDLFKERNTLEETDADRETLFLLPLS